VEDRGVKESSEIAQASIPHLEFLSLRGELIKYFAAIHVDTLFKSQNVLEADTSMGALEKNPSVPIIPMLQDH
jgi:hypothetical protein